MSRLADRLENAWDDLRDVPVPPTGAERTLFVFLWAAVTAWMFGSSRWWWWIALAGLVTIALLAGTGWLLRYQLGRRVEQAEEHDRMG